MYKKRNRLTIQQYVSGILGGDRVALGRAITLAESTLSTDQQLAEKVINEVLPYTGNSIRIGITGVPGVGKSTFIESFGKQILDQGHKLAVLTIDPSSQKTGGSILGDKTRMETLASDKRAFIRPTPAGSTLGGVGAKTREAMLLCEAAGYDVVFIETVGVGQSETMVKGMVDFFLLLMLAGAGDELQGIKKGIIEIADALVVTKADGDNFEKSKMAKKEYDRALHLFPTSENSWQPKVKICSAIENFGLGEIWEMILDFEQIMKTNGYFDDNRSKQRLDWMHGHIRLLLENRFYQDKAIAEKLEKMTPLVLKGERSSITMARDLVKEFLVEKKHDL
ncbi:MAG: methylmalonyl Co-A mutase-associated GTPase MeaB [Anditalea sp.]